jgi:hypothetical protein
MQFSFDIGGKTRRYLSWGKRIPYRFPAEQARIIQLLVQRVTLSPTGLRIDMKTAGMRELIQSVIPGRKAA